MFLLTKYAAFVWSPYFWPALVVALILRSVVKMYLLRMRLPPGPMPWPLVGNFPIFFKTKLLMHDLCLELSKKYGETITIFFAGNPCIVMNKYESAKEVFQQATFSDRFESAVMDSVFDGQQDMAFGPYNSTTQFLRKVTTRSIRSLISAEKVENQVAWATDFSIDEMSLEKPSVEPRRHARVLIYNIILGFAFGKTYKLNDPDFRMLMDASDKGNKNFSKALALDFLPFAKYWPLKRFSAVKGFMEIITLFNDYAERQVQEHRLSYQQGTIRDFTDSLLNEQIQLATEGTSDRLTDTDLKLLLLDFYSAGTETTSVTLNWLMLYLILYPEIQEECYQAIKEAIGDRQVRLSDRGNMPIIDACIMETLRLRPPASMGLPRSPNSDAQIGDYFIPKGTLMMANLYAMQVDPDHWQDPLEFNPRLHFIDEAGQIRKSQSFMAFGTGRRVCLGEQLGKNILFLAVVNLLQKVKWERVPRFDYTTDADPEINFANQTHPYRVLMEKRKS